MPHHWTIEEDNQLRACVESGMSDNETSKLLNRSADSVRRRKERFHFTEQDRWTELETDILRHMYQAGRGDLAIARRLGRTIHSISGRRRILGMSSRERDQDAYRTYRIIESRSYADSLQRSMSVGYSPTCTWFTDFPNRVVCGKKSALGRSYCPEHCKRVFQGYVWRSEKSA